mgnify:CR=1 FL=1
MLEKIIAWSLRNTFLVVLGTIFFIAAGVYSLYRTPLDAIPDLSDVQVIVYSEFPGQAPQVVEDQVTYPLTTRMLSVPGAKTVRGYSFFGSSFVYIIFEDGTDLYWARSRVLEYLNASAAQLPRGVTPTLGPDATGVGWVYEYTLHSDRHTLQELRSIQDWYLRYELAALEGVSEVASLGGFVKEYQVAVDPNRLLAYDLPITEVIMAIEKANLDVGGGTVEMGETEFMVRSRGYIKNVEDLGNVVVGSGADGTPVLVRHLAEVRLGPEMRRGVAEWNGEGETVGGIVVMRYGENALTTIEGVKEKLRSLEAGLPEGVTIRTAYDRSGLIQRAIATLREKLVEESIVVALVILVFLLHLPSAMVAIITLPVAVLMAFTVMYVQGINANIMSLGGIAIAIGAMVDAAIIMIENAHKHLERDRGKKPHGRIILDAAVEVGPTLFFSLLVITVSFVPVFTLTEQSGRLFKPLAFTKTYAMAAAAFLSVTLVPVLMGWFIRGRIREEKANPINRLLIALYHPLVDLVLRWRKTTIVLALAAMLSIAYPLTRMGSEFMPSLYEGDLLYMPTTLPGLSVTKAREILQQTDRIIKQFPEVERVFGKIGRAETATDPAPMMMIETTITLKPESQWRRVHLERFYSGWPQRLGPLKGVLGLVWPEERPLTVAELIARLDAAIRFPGLTNAWTMPIKTRIDMLSTGIKTPVGVKIMGNDPVVLNRLGEEVEATLRHLPGTLSAISERTLGGRYLDIAIDRLAAARYGIGVGAIQEVIRTAVGGMAVGETVEGLERYPISVRYNRDFRDDIDSLKQVLVPAVGGRHIPLGQVATFAISRDADSIKSENGRRSTWVYVDLRDIDIGTYVDRAREAVAGHVQLPPGYNIVWSGQYEYMEKARARLMVIIPLTVLIIFVIIHVNTGSLVKTGIVFLAVPFSLVGAFWLLYALDYHLSVAVWVGLIALAGLDAETGVVMLLYLDLAYKKWRDEGRMVTSGDLVAAIHHGAVQRIRPKVMTIAVIIAGLLPIMWSHGAGADVMKRIAAPMVGGVLTSGIMELLVYPVIFYLWRGRGLFPSIEESTGNTPPQPLAAG